VFVAGSALSFVYMFQLHQRDFWRAAGPGAASPWLRQLPTAMLAALVLASSGLVLVLASAGRGELDPLATALGLTAAVVYSAYILVSGSIAARVPPRAFSTLVCSGAAITLTIGAALLGELRPGDVTVGGWGWLACLALISTVGAVSLFFVGIARVGPTVASILSTVEPAVTVLLAFVVFGEVLGAAQLLGGPGQQCRRAQGLALRGLHRLGRRGGGVAERLDRPQAVALALQLALNGAASVHAIDIDRNAVANTLANAYRNGVAERVTGATADLFDWEPERAYDLVVASLYQLPVDPFREPTGHRPLDYWGRTILDRFLRLLPRLLAPDGTAYVMQLSIVGQLATERLLAASGLTARVVDFSFFPFGPLFVASREQIRRVEELSDAYHIAVGDEDVVVAYLLEVTHAAP